MSAAPPSDYDPAIALFSRLRHHNTVHLEALADRWGVAASDIRAIYFLSNHDEVTPKRVAEFLGITTGAMTSLVDRVERAGLVQRTAHPTDRRSIILELTERGAEAVTDSLGHYRAAFAAAIPGKDLEEVAQLFGRMSVALTDQTREITASAR